MIIPEGSKIVIYNKTFSVTENGIETTNDVDIEDNSIMLFDDYLFCTDQKCVEKIDDNTYQINVWNQDAICIKDGILYESISDAD